MCVYTCDNVSSHLCLRVWLRVTVRVFSRVFPVVIACVRTCVCLLKASRSSIQGFPLKFSENSLKGSLPPAGVQGFLGDATLVVDPFESSAWIATLRAAGLEGWATGDNGLNIHICAREGIAPCNV